MTLARDITGREAAYLALAAQASAPYAAFVYASTEHAERIDAHLFAHDAGDVARGFGRLWLDGGAVAGMFTAIPGRELARTRLKAALALRKASLLDPDEQRRTQLAGQALARPADTDHYLSRIAVAESARGTGIGAALLAAFEAEGRTAGARRLLLEVSPVHAAALRLYQRAGFTIAATHEARDEPSGRVLVYHHLSKALDG